MASSSHPLQVHSICRSGPDKATDRAARKGSKEQSQARILAAASRRVDTEMDAPVVAACRPLVLVRRKLRRTLLMFSAWIAARHPHRSRSLPSQIRFTPKKREI